MDQHSIKVLSWLLQEIRNTREELKRIEKRVVELVYFEERREEPKQEPEQKEVDTNGETEKIFIPGIDSPKPTYIRCGCFKEEETGKMNRSNCSIHRHMNLD